jgi:hypothetical protein
MADFQKTVDTINEEISKLQALEYTAWTHKLLSRSVNCFALTVYQ